MSYEVPVPPAGVCGLETNCRQTRHIRLPSDEGLSPSAGGGQTFPGGLIEPGVVRTSEAVAPIYQRPLTNLPRPRPTPRTREEEQGGAHLYRRVTVALLGARAGTAAQVLCDHTGRQDLTGHIPVIFKQLHSHS